MFLSPYIGIGNLPRALPVPLAETGHGETGAEFTRRERPFHSPGPKSSKGGWTRWVTDQRTSAQVKNVQVLMATTTDFAGEKVVPPHLLIVPLFFRTDESIMTDTKGERAK